MWAGEFEPGRKGGGGGWTRCIIVFVKMVDGNFFYLSLSNCRVSFCSSKTWLSNLTMVSKLSLRSRDYVSLFDSHAYLCCSKAFLVSMKTSFKHNFHTFAPIIKKGLKKISSCDENLLSLQTTQSAREICHMKLKKKISPLQFRTSPNRIWY